MRTGSSAPPAKATKRSANASASLDGHAAHALHCCTAAIKRRTSSARTRTGRSPGAPHLRGSRDALAREPRDEGATPAPRQTVQAEAKIWRLRVRFSSDIPGVARVGERCRRIFQKGGDTYFGRALSDYYEGQAAGFAKDYAVRDGCSRMPSRVFAEFGQDHLTGEPRQRSGPSIFTGARISARFPIFDRALEAFDPVADERPLTATVNNRAATLSRLERYDEARVAYARALNIALKRNMKALVQVIRDGLAEMDFRRGTLRARPFRVSPTLWKDAIRAGFENEAVFAHLYVAECLGRLGRDAEMAESIDASARPEAELLLRPSAGHGGTVRVPRPGNARCGPRQERARTPRARAERRENSRATVAVRFLRRRRAAEPWATGAARGGRWRRSPPRRGRRGSAGGRAFPRAGCRGRRRGSGRLKPRPGSRRVG